MTIMHFVIDGDSVVFQSDVEYRFELTDFPDLVSAHLKYVVEKPKTKSTLACEKLGLQFRHKKIQNFDWEYLEPFIRDVCRWGGFALIGGRVVTNNKPGDIVRSFQAANKHMDQGEPQIGDALREINTIKFLGTPSFASKHLRFLRPELCPVLDSNTRRLGYDFTPDGYERFAVDCKAIASALIERRIENPIDGRQEEWFVGDVDIALFAQLRGWG